MRPISQGRLVYVKGRLRTDQWQDKETQETHYRTIVISSNMQMLDRKKTVPEVMAEP